MVEFTGPIDFIASVVGATIPLFLPLLVITLIGLFLFNWFQKKFQWKWMGSSIAVVYILWFVFLVGIHAWNIYSATQQIDLSVIPPDIRANPLFQQTYSEDAISLFVQAIFQSLITAGIFSLICMPFVFLGLVTFELIGKRVKSIWAKLILNTWGWCLVLVLLMLAFPWILTGLIYLAFFGI